MDRKAIGKNIRRLREDERHLTQEEFATVAGIHVRTLQRAESGNFALQTLKDIANALETTPDELANAIASTVCRELKAVWSKPRSDWRPNHNEHVQTCRTCRDNKERLDVDLRGFDGFLQEEIEEWVVDSLRKDLKRALHYEEVLSLEKLLTEEQILAINSRIREAERQFESADLNALYIDIINILEHTAHHELGVPCQGANPC